MSTKPALYLAALCLAGQGCSPLGQAARTTLLEPTEYCQRVDDAADCSRNKALAERAWKEFQQYYQGTVFSSHFALGFKDGFADYLFAGGQGNPPPLGPRPYWRPEFETPMGQQATRDWFAGFREGAAIARGSGLRELVTLPASVALTSTRPSLDTNRASPGQPGIEPGSPIQGGTGVTPQRPLDRMSCLCRGPFVERGARRGEGQGPKGMGDTSPFIPTVWTTPRTQEFPPWSVSRIFP